MSKNVTININLTKLQVEEILSEVHDDNITMKDSGWDSLTEHPIELNYWEIKKIARVLGYDSNEVLNTLLQFAMKKIDPEHLEPKEADPCVSNTDFIEKLEELIASIKK